MPTAHLDPRELRPRLLPPHSDAPAIELAPGVRVGLAFGPGEAPVDHAQLAAWRTSVRDLLPAALAATRLGGAAELLQEAEALPGLFLASGEDPAALLMALPELLGPAEGGIVAGVPSQGQILAAPLHSLADLGTIQVLATVVALAYATAEDPLSRDLYWFGGHRWEKLVVDFAPNGDAVVRPTPSFSAALTLLASDLAPLGEA